MEILFLSQYFYPEHFVNNHIAKKLVAEGHQVDVVCCVPNYPSGKFFEGYSNSSLRHEEWNGVTIHRTFTVARGSSSVQLLLNYLVYPVAAAARLMRIRPRTADVSFVSMPSPLFQAVAGIFAKWVWEIPTVYWVQDIWPDSAIITLGIKNRGIVWMLDKICGAIYRQADLVMVQSDGFHENLKRFGIPDDKIVTLPNCAPPDFRPLKDDEIPDRIRALVPSDKFTVMFAGNIGASQDFETVIGAIERIPDNVDICLAVVGSGREEAAVRALVEEKGLQSRIIFLGRHAEADMPAFFACADAMLVTLRDEEIFAVTVPSKVQAYLACGKPIVGSLAGEGAAIIEDAKVGFVAPPSSPEALSRAFEAMACLSPEELQRLGRSAEELYQSQFSLNAVHSKLIAHLGRVVAER
ncbi:glycosyltransferase family 4 protein [Altererythrobacter sp.]|nr:glycosyltransferase family 4 protein [Altererythrobacter sp.]